MTKQKRLHSAAHLTLFKLVCSFSHIQLGTAYVISIPSLAVGQDVITQVYHLSLRTAAPESPRHLNVSLTMMKKTHLLYIILPMPI